MQAVERHDSIFLSGVLKWAVSPDFVPDDEGIRRAASSTLPASAPDSDALIFEQPVNHFFHLKDMGSLPVYFVTGFTMRVLITKRSGFWWYPVCDSFFRHAYQYLVTAKAS